MTQEPARYFLTIEWCRDGQRGIFCNEDGATFPLRQRAPHPGCHVAAHSIRHRILKDIGKY